MPTTPALSSVIASSRDRAGNDPIFVLNAEAARRRAAGESIVNATIGALMTDDGRLAVMPSVLDAFARAHSAGSAGYAPISGVPAFRQAVLSSLFSDGPLANRSTAVATPGGTGAIYQAVVNFLEPGQALLTSSYFWGPYRALTAHAGRGIDTFRMFGPDGAFDATALESAMDRQAETQGRVLLVLNTPCHNPTGYSLAPNEWQAIGDIVGRVGSRVPVTVLIDAAYMRYGGASATTWIEAVPDLLRAATVLVAWTASKSYTQYGSRVGALVALHRDPDELAQIDNALGYTCRATWSNCNHLGQLAVTELLTEPELVARSDEERDGLVRLLQERIDVFNEHSASAGLRTPRYDSGFFVAVFTEDSAATARTMRDEGVYVVPIDGAVRVALCCTPAEVVPRMIEVLARGVAAAG
ncbi:MAG: aminotransferase class I/II-fold pyridoxal phosphate-dependent enzyme [Gemmatimonadetes bacterium]|nr:aminotransferase class I/II-fold pyridoxal phosphate-dependent enzyme [Gemmatimonadota bacterium]